MTKPKKPPSPGKGGTKKKAPHADAASPDGYSVLARKYRPSTFGELIGQEAMVRTLSNAFAGNRIAQAYMLTGVRGVGKTTTARILARALNYEAPGVDGPTVDMGEIGAHCAAIMESRHVDVLEMDAASHTGIDDIREIIESARYKPVTARTKVYIIDEVHMLSKAAFNGLLKTLEEPPEHVKFIFATTEIRKVPVTVLSRCQRFDLRRVDVEVLHEHFARIAKLENIEIDDEALALIARAAEGSVRDGLSLLDQAIAHGDGKVAGSHMRAMLGLADRGRVFDLLETVLKGDAKGALDGLAGLHGDGAEPVQVLNDMADAVHVITRIVAAGADAADPILSEAELARAGDLAGKLDMPALARAWQMLLKGASEAQAAPRPLAAAEMVLVRMTYLADAPTPEELANRLGDAPGTGSKAAPASGNGGAPAEARSHASVASVTGGAQARAIDPEAALPEREADPEQTPDPVQMPESFADVVALVEQHRDLRLARAIQDGARLVSYAPPHIEINPHEGAPASLANDLRTFLSRVTGRPWIVAVSDSEGEKTISEQRREAREAEQAREAAKREELKNHPSVR
ncbi:MAG: DNA polymerase III subunit gamma/tau, partial [Hyphomicrobiales bacterium]|nr:DNA polymerase III subunit gamma/tau [Hyphomicrobiales bacterium]